MKSLSSLLIYFKCLITLFLHWIFFVFDITFKVVLFLLWHLLFYLSINSLIILSPFLLQSVFLAYIQGFLINLVCFLISENDIVYFLACRFLTFLILVHLLIIKILQKTFKLLNSKISLFLIKTLLISSDI